MDVVVRIVAQREPGRGGGLIGDRDDGPGNLAQVGLGRRVDRPGRLDEASQSADGPGLRVILDVDVQQRVALLHHRQGGIEHRRIQVVSQLGHHAKVQRALLREPVIHPLEGTKRTNQSTPRLKLLLIAVIAFGPMDHCFVGTRIQILFSFRCAGGAAVSVESAATRVQH